MRGPSRPSTRERGGRPSHCDARAKTGAPQASLTERGRLRRTLSHGDFLGAIRGIFRPPETVVMIHYI